MSDTPAMRVLGIDPGLQRAGYCVLDLPARGLEPVLVEAGLLRLRVKDSVPDRLVQLEQDLLEVIEEHAPTDLAIEDIYSHYKHPRTAIIMGHGRGVALLVARRAAMQIHSLSPREIKKSVSGSGSATKAQMQLAVQTQFRLAQPPEPHDVADAMAIALTFARRSLLLRLTKN